MIAADDHRKIGALADRHQPFISRPPSRHSIRLSRRHPEVRAPIIDVRGPRTDVVPALLALGSAAIERFLGNPTDLVNLLNEQ